MLAAFEGYLVHPTSFGAKAADLGPARNAAKLRQLSDKAQVIDHLNKGFRAREERARGARRRHADRQAQDHGTGSVVR
jgi:hypothetical protein